ncbi:helix-hairpin-helix domain-containing protein [Streptomyces sp. TR06-5]|uniref:helix-hairpin-helix domain-containing protein n=1 Tax=unclassified Streptomyces TaxID=2593676 RepID=UPI0039A06E2C
MQLRCAVEGRTLAALSLALLVAVGFGVYRFVDGGPRTVRVAAAEPVAAPVRTASGTDSAEAGGRFLVIDVAGEVRDPGVHRLPQGSRVEDALEAAGGVRPEAGEEAQSALNRARRLVDGEQILVGAPRAPGTVAGGVPGTPPAVAPRISLSSATAAELETLPGVGPVLARHIIEHRLAHGGFTSVGGLREVDGIGDARFADLQPLVSP